MVAETVLTLLGILSLRTIKAPAVVAPSVGLPVVRASGPMAYAPTRKNFDSYGVDVSARSYIVLDVKSGKVLAEKGADAPYPVASLTKLVTAMTILDMEPDFARLIDMNASDRGRIGRIQVPLDERFTEGELLSYMLVASSNEAAHALMRAHGNQEFIEAMNRKAKDIGMTHAKFYDASGLDPRNTASARDIAMALRAALDYPEISDRTKRASFKAVGRIKNTSVLLKSTNLLLASDLNRDPYTIVAGKTGSLDEAGFCFAQAVSDASNHEIIAVVLGAETHYSRFQDVKSLTYWAYANYEWPALAAAGR